MTTMLYALFFLLQPLFAERPPYTPEQLSLIRDVTGIAISADGKTIAFTTDITGAFELWAIPSRGGFPSQISSLGENVSDIAYSPDGKTLIFASDYGGNERPDLFLVDAAGGIPTNITASTQAEKNPRFSPTSRFIAYLSDPQQEFVFELMVLERETEEVRQLSFEGVNVHEILWSPDEAFLVVTRSGDDRHGELLFFDFKTSKKRVVKPPVKDSIIFAQDFSPDGKTLLTTTHNKQGFMQLYLLNLKNRRGQFIGPESWDVQEAKWHSDSGILFTRNEAGRSALYRMKDPDAQAEALLPAQGYITDFDIDESGSQIAYLWSDSRHPADAWVFNLKNKTKRPVTKSLMAGVVPEELSEAQSFSYLSFDAKAIPCFYFKPRFFRLGNPPPGVVLVHGGPDWQVFDDFYPLRQVLAEAGFAVILPNYRGSTGYGKEFEDANNKDWGGGDLNDIVHAVHFLAAKDEIDPQRLGIMGGSFGGFMTLTALAKTPEIWKAGIDAYGMPDLVLDYELSESRFADWYKTEMGTPKTHPKLFKERSPIHFIDKIRVPLLIFQGANDTNVPKAEGELIFNKLKEQGNVVQLVVYPDEGHGFTKRKNRLDYYKKTLDFFVKHLSK